MLSSHTVSNVLDLLAFCEYMNLVQTDEYSFFNYDVRELIIHNLLDCDDDFC